MSTTNDSEDWPYKELEDNVLHVIEHSTLDEHAQMELIMGHVREFYAHYLKPEDVERAVRKADEDGYRRGVFNFRDYFMDASIPGLRNPVGMGIAEDLVKNYQFPERPITEIEPIQLSKLNREEEKDEDA